jgi:chromosome segregation ATPase
MDKEALQRQLDDMEEASERWRAERRRLNAEIDKLENALADAKTDTTRKRDSDKSQAVDPRAIARVQDAADQKLKKASEEWEVDRAKLTAKINRLEGALAEAIARASNPLRVTQSVKEQFELELTRVAKEKTELEQAYLRAKTEWEQEKLKMTGEAVKLRRAAQIMGRPVPKENAPEVNPKVRDLQNQLKENLSQWNAERDQLAAQIRKHEDSARQWDAERRQLSDHAGQLQEALTQAQAKVQTFEVAARKPNLAKLQADELKRELEDAKRENDALQQLVKEGRDALEAERRRMTSDVQKLRNEVQQASERSDNLNSQAADRLLEESRKKWESEQRRLTSRVAELEGKLDEVTKKGAQVSNEVHDQLRQQYEQRLQEALQQKTKLVQELKSASDLLEAERSRGSSNGGVGFDPLAVQSEISRVEGLLNEIVTVIENPNTDLSVVIRKNVEKAELDSYLRGILFTLGKG